MSSEQKTTNNTSATKPSSSQTHNPLKSVTVSQPLTRLETNSIHDKATEQRNK